LLLSGTAFATGIVTRGHAVILKIDNQKKSVLNPLVSGWGETGSGSAAVASYVGNNDCMVVATGKNTMKPIAISDRDGDGQLDLCYSSDHFEHVSADKTGNAVAFGADFPFNPTITNSGKPEVYLYQRPNIVQVTGSWSAHGWSAWDPGVSNDGHTVAFVGNGDPVGENPAGLQ